MPRANFLREGDFAITIEPRFDQGMTCGTAQCILARAFAGGGIKSAQIDARVLLCAALGVDHADLIRDPDRPLGPRAATVGTFASRRLKHEPVARIIGYRDFWRSRFKIGPAVLDPRPATEMLIDVVLGHAARSPRENWRILDLGTGSGAILCSLLLSLPGAFGIGVDISQGACAIARDNLNAHGLARRGIIICGDWTHALSGPFDVIVTNPPYVSRGEIARLAPEVRDHDPSVALDGGDDGLVAYKEIIPASPTLLAPGGLIALEIGKGQRFAVQSLLQNAFDTPVEFRLDLDGQWRVAMTCSAKE
jgi:release factor glutamine methyltransferase